MTDPIIPGVHPMPTAEVTKRLFVIKELVQTLLPIVELRYPDLHRAHIMELFSTVALSGVFAYAGEDFARRMLDLQVRSLPGRPQPDTPEAPR